MKLSEEEKQLIIEHRKVRAEQEKVHPIKSLDSYTVEEKCKHFDSLHEMAKDELEHYRNYGYGYKDWVSVCYEMTMELLGKDVWKAVAQAEEKFRNK